MSLSTAKPVATFQIFPSTGANKAPFKVSRLSMMQRRVLPPPQTHFAAPDSIPVKGKEKPLLLENLNTSATRRELFHLTATSLGLMSLVSPAFAAEVQTKNASILEKIIEKFNELTSSSNPKDEAKDTKPKVNNGEEKKKKSNGGQEKLPSTINGKTVETSAVP
ncbi:uncharacterized protein LOC127263878 [Andrographis paniculata]|uniref:uncharacterized protein LOC127263878 n=1 Tax=Andrographis paniculata TaxID=175694 RepID=UPI0021E7BF98|nr:uncharacterized protein LOC127263878 [Andrographis paniculata]